MNILVISSSLDSQSRSERLAVWCAEILKQNGIQSSLIRLKDHPLGGFDNTPAKASTSHALLHSTIKQADGLVFASPVYNWGCCAELKKMIEHVGSTDPQQGVRGAFYDKVVTFVNAAGLPHSYMAFTSLANSMMLDFKCIINPYNVYVHNRHWEADALTRRIQGSR